MDEITEYDLFDEYMDHDALSCIDDYNRYEENQIFLDNDFDNGYDSDQYMDVDPDPLDYDWPYDYDV